MKHSECWMATCVLALVVGVGVGRAQEKPAKPEPVTVPPVVYFPPVPPAHALTAELAAMEAAGCKASSPAVPAAEAKCKTCTGCAACTQTKTDDCCGDCAKSKKDAFASGGSGECAPPKKVKKAKRIKDVEYFQIAVPPPYSPVPMAPPGTAAGSSRRQGAPLHLTGGISHRYLPAFR